MREIKRTAVGLEDVTPTTTAPEHEPGDFDEAPTKPRRVPTMNREQRRAMSRWAKSPAGKAALAKARAERRKAKEP